MHINSLCQFIKNCETGKEISLPFGIEARREYENLILEKRRESMCKIASERISKQKEINNKIPKDQSM